MLHHGHEAVIVGPLLAVTVAAAPPLHVQLRVSHTLTGATVTALLRLAVAVAATTAVQVVVVVVEAVVGGVVIATGMPLGVVVAMLPVPTIGKGTLTDNQEEETGRGMAVVGTVDRIAAARLADENATPMLILVHCPGRL